MDVRYTVYSVKDGLPLIVHATIPRCAAVLGITVATFMTQASKQRHGRGRDGSKRKWRIIRDEED